MMIRVVVRDIFCGSGEWYEWEVGVLLRRLLL